MSHFEPSPLQNCVNQKGTTELQQNQSGKFVVQFWGVRGLIPTPTSNTSRYGGNTACVEIQVGETRLIFDGGTGLRILGKTWLERHTRLEAHLFFTNSQSNRIQGFPFFAPAFFPDNCFHIYGTAASNGASIKQCLCDQMLQPHFPYPLQVMQSELLFHHLVPDWVIKLDDVTVSTGLINHTQKSMGYRITWQDHSVAYITDIHKRASKSEREKIIQITNNVDLLIANATYTPGVAGHNSDDHHIQWLTALDLAHSTGVKRLVITHHHPDDSDDFLDQVQAEVQSAFPKALLAHEGLVLAVV